MQTRHTILEYDETIYHVKYLFSKGSNGDGYLIPDFKDEIDILETIPKTKELNKLEELIREEYGIS